jgi:hypothetical protein
MDIKLGMPRSPDHAIVAASNAPSAVLPYADYICDGVADDVEINAALAARSAVTCYGTFNFTAPVLIATGKHLTLPRGSKFVAGAGMTKVIGGGTNATDWTFDGGGEIDCQNVNSIVGIHLISNQRCVIRDPRISNCNAGYGMRFQATGGVNCVNNMVFGGQMTNVFVGIKYDGLSGSYVTLNRIFGMEMGIVTGTGIEFTQFADNNRGYAVWISLTANNAVGVLYNNSATPAADAAVYADDFDGIEIDAFGGLTGVSGVKMNVTKQINWKNFYHSPDAFPGGLSALVNEVSNRAYSYRFEINPAAAQNNMVVIEKNRGVIQNITAAATAIDVSNTDWVQLTADASYTLTATPTIADGVLGQRKYILNTDTVDSITLQDEATLAGSNIRFGFPSMTLGPRQGAWFVYDGTDWIWEGGTGRRSAQYFGDGTSTVPSIAFAADTGTGFDRIGAGDLGVVLSSVLRMRFRTTGLEFQDNNGFMAIFDSALHEMLKFETVTNAVNQIQVKNSVAGSPPEVKATGDDPNVDLKFVPQGTGVVQYGTHAATTTELVTGYITIRDAGGTLRKLAVVS